MATAMSKMGRFLPGLKALILAPSQVVVRDVPEIASQLGIGVIQLSKFKTTVRKDSHFMATAMCKDSHLQVGPCGQQRLCQKTSRLSVAHLLKIVLHSDHVVELEVTDWAGESDLTVTSSGDLSAPTSASRP